MVVFPFKMGNSMSLILLIMIIKSKEQIYKVGIMGKNEEEEGE